MLTPRENEILNFISQGFKNKEIASLLFLSPCTIRNHISNIFIKLQVTNRVQAVMKLYNLRQEQPHPNNA